MPLPLSVIDFASVNEGQAVGDAFANSVALAQHAEQLGYERVWYAEHHNMPTIASSSPAVLIAHIASQTERIRLGSGGVMLPNHSPLVIAEQFGTLGEIHPGRIDLGLGRAPGTDQQTVAALRRDPSSAERFPNDVRELQGYLRGQSLIPGVDAVPGKGTNVPLYILGSSLFGAQLAAAFGLPYSFASHFSPDALEQAVAAYRENFQPGEQLSEPYVIAAVNVVADDDPARAEHEYHLYKRARIKLMARQGRDLSDDELDMVMDSAGGRQILAMLKYTAVGDGPAVKEYLDDFAKTAQADELMIAPVGSTREQVHGTMEVVRRVWGE